MKKFLLFISVFSISILVNAQAGSLDLSFDTDGIVTTSVGTDNDESYSMALQSDGKIVVVGKSFNGTDDNFTVVRYNTDGSLDNTFDSDGKVITNISPGYPDGALSVAIQSDGKIVAAGYTSDTAYNFTIAVVRYNTNGSLDNSFDSDGIVLTSVNGTEDMAYSVKIQSDGKIVLGGFTDVSLDYDYLVVRYNPNGSLDLSFDSDGIATASTGNLDYGYSVAIQLDGKILLGGSGSPGGAEFVVVRFNDDGSLDNTFDSDGIASTNLGTFASGSFIALQSDAKIILAGESGSSPNKNFTVVRYNSDGSLDNSFDTDGMVITDFSGGNDRGQAVAIQSDGKIVVNGFTGGGPNEDLALVRYNADGSLDNSFDFDGMVTTPAGTSDDRCYGIAIQTDGKILVAGYTLNLPMATNDFLVVRYSTDQLGIEPGGDWVTCVYPNPVTDILNLDFSKPINNLQAIILDMNGKTILNTKLHGFQSGLNMNHLRSGTYLVQITDGKSFQTFKITKE